MYPAFYFMNNLPLFLPPCILKVQHGTKKPPTRPRSPFKEVVSKVISDKNIIEEKWSNLVDDVHSDYSWEQEKIVLDTKAKVFIFSFL